MQSPRVFVLAAALAAAGCMGEIAGDELTEGPAGAVGPEPSPRAPGQPAAVSPPAPSPPAAEPPSPGTEARPAAAAWRRLTKVQYENTVRDLVQLAVRDPREATTVMAHVAPALARLPGDLRTPPGHEPRGGYRRLDQDVTPEFVEGTYAVAVAVAAQLGQRLGAVVGGCATDRDPANDAECLTQFIHRFGERALRRPLTGEDVAFFRGVFGAGTGIDGPRVANVLLAMLTAAEHLYHVELGAPSLTAHELAARLSYHFWNTMPDNVLWEAAGKGLLVTPDGYRQQLERLLRDPRARPAAREFYRDWLQLDDLPNMAALDSGTLRAAAAFRAFAGDLRPGLKELRAAMIEDALALVDHYTFTRPGTVRDLLTSPLAFPTNETLARIYGLPVWQGGEPPAFPDGQRPGLFTRAAFVATGLVRTSPVRKGVFLREAVLCDLLPPPPADADMDTSRLDEQRMTTRQIVESLTEARGTGCAACHTNLINHLGYPTENFDALGRAVTHQRLFSVDGREVARLPVDTRALPQVVVGDRTPVGNAAELMQLLLRSDKVPGCLARQYFRFTFGRVEDPRKDAAILARLTRAARDGTLADLHREVALAPEFRQRQTAEQE